MNLTDTEQKSGSGSVVSNAVNARLGEHWLIPVRIVIVIVAVLALAVFIVGVLLNFAQFRTVCTPLSSADGQLTPESAQALQALGLSLDVYAIMNVVFLVIQALVPKRLVIVCCEQSQPHSGEVSNTTPFLRSKELGGTGAWWDKSG